jgi:hypothetical protein
MLPPPFNTLVACSWSGLSTDALLPSTSFVAAFPSSAELEKTKLRGRGEKGAQGSPASCP